MVLKRWQLDIYTLVHYIAATQGGNGGFGTVEDR